ncbi:MAG: TonB-dependent receptor plug domain-containing protein [Caulobacteraceae bacterium]
MAKSLGGRRSLLLTVAALPLLAAGAARAATADATPSSSVSEVVVTATRQSQAISKVAESVSAFPAARLQVLNVKSFADLAKFTPGVSFDQDRHDVSIRGIDSKAGSGTTGIYIDDTPIQARALGLNANNTLPVVFDLQRVEVLRGPQGTLFGAGSEGGTVRYITTQPSLTSFSANAHAEVATTENGAPSYEFGAAAGGPIIDDKIGFRVSAWARRDGGWVDRNNGGDVGGIENDANRVDTYVLRGALTFAPTDNVLITPSVNYENRHQHNHDEYWVGISDPSAGNFVSGTPELMRDADRFLLPALKIEWDAGPLRFISNTAYYDRLEHVNGYSGHALQPVVFPALHQQHRPRSDRRRHQRDPRPAAEPGRSAVQHAGRLRPGASRQHAGLHPRQPADAQGPQPARLRALFVDQPDHQLAAEHHPGVPRTVGGSERAPDLDRRRVLRLQHPAQHRGDPRPAAAGADPVFVGRGHDHRLGHGPVAQRRRLHQRHPGARPADRAVRRRRLQDHRQAEVGSRPALRLDPLRLPQSQQRRPGPARQWRGSRQRRAATRTKRPSRQR